MCCTSLWYFSKSSHDNRKRDKRTKYMISEIKFHKLLHLWSIHIPNHEHTSVVWQLQSLIKKKLCYVWWHKVIKTIQRLTSVLNISDTTELFFFFFYSIFVSISLFSVLHIEVPVIRDARTNRPKVGIRSGSAIG